MEKQISTDEIIAGLREGEKVYRGFKHGLETATAFKALETRQVELEKMIDQLNATAKKLADDNTLAVMAIKDAESRARVIVSAAEAKAETLINDAQATILDAANKAQEDLKGVVLDLAEVKDEVLEATQERDILKSEIKDLEELKEKTRAKLLDGVA